MVRIYAKPLFVTRVGETGAWQGAVMISTKQHGELANLGPGDFFGEMALLNDEPRSATVEATTNCSFLLMDRKTFTRLLGPLRQLLDAIADGRVR